LRNVFSMGPAWLEESARLLHVILVFLALPLLEREQLQVKVDFVVGLLPKTLALAFRLFALALTFLFGSCFLYSLWLLTKKTGDVLMAGTGLPNAVLFIPVFVGMLLFALAVFAALVTQIRGAKYAVAKGVAS